MADSSQTPAYSISAVARMLGITPSALRSWEERYGTVRPARSKGSQRLYSRAQVDQLLFVKGQLDEGVQLSQAFRLLAQQLEMGVQPAAAPVRPPSHPILILLAERDPYAAELEEYFLRTEGYDVRVALSTAEAERLLSEQSPEVAIVDLLISGNQGLDFCRRIREHGGIRVLAVAAMDLGDEALAAGAEAFLQKPLAPLQLVSTVKDLLGTSALARVGARMPAR
jgi:DNA-binding transcriptional MerR regulator